MIWSNNKLKISYYVLNLILVFFGMIHKLIGFEKAWEVRKTIFINFGGMVIGFIVIGLILNNL